MKKSIFTITIFALLAGLFLTKPQITRAQASITYYFPSEIYDNEESITISFSNLSSSTNYRIVIDGGKEPFGKYTSDWITPRPDPNNHGVYYIEDVVFKAQNPVVFYSGLAGDVSHHYKVSLEWGNLFTRQKFGTPGYTVFRFSPESCSNFELVPNVIDFDMLNNNSAFFLATDLDQSLLYGIQAYDQNGKPAGGKQALKPNTSNTLRINASDVLSQPYKEGFFTAKLMERGVFICELSFNILHVITPGTTPIIVSKGVTDLCGSSTTNSKFNDCNNCISVGLTPCENGGSWTALGCICSGTPDDFLKWLLPFAIGIAGGIAIVLMIIGGLQIATSAGNPERIENGKGMITSALTGLILIIFSIFILRVVGVNLLGIFE